MAKCLLRIDDKNHPNSLRLLWQQITKYGRWQCRFIDGFLCVQFSLRMSTIWDFRCWRRRLKMIEINVCTSLMPPIQRKSCPDGWCRIWDIYLYKESVVSVCGRSPSYVISGMRFVRHWFKLASAIELLKWLNARIVWCAEEKNPGNNWAVVTGEGNGVYWMSVLVRNGNTLHATKHSSYRELPVGENSIEPEYPVSFTVNYISFPKVRTNDAVLSVWALLCQSHSSASSAHIKCVKIAAIPRAAATYTAACTHELIPFPNRRQFNVN